MSSIKELKTMVSEELEENEIQQSVDYMTKSHLRNVMQLAVFYTSDENLYAVNISKIQSFIIKDDVEILDSPTKGAYVIGMINLRDEVISIVDFDKWIGAKKTSSEEQRIIIFCNYNMRKIGILVKDILKIDEKASNELRVPNSKDPKISYVTDIDDDKDKNSSKMCIVFDAEKLLYDANLGSGSSDSTIYDIAAIKSIENVSNKKLVLVAEDSQIVIEKLHEFLSKIGANYEIYENGQLLIDRVNGLNPDEIGIIITDIEMPIKNGYQVIKYVKQDSKYGQVPVLSLTSMTNKGVEDKVKQLGAIDLINKSDLKTLNKYIKDILKERK
jgi:two-component system chemotaxis response regulator CheV